MMEAKEKTVKKSKKKGVENKISEKNRISKTGIAIRELWGTGKILDLKAVLK